MESKTRQYKLSTLMLITASAGALSLFVGSSNRYALVGLMVQLMIVGLCYHQIRIGKPSRAIAVLLLYMVLLAETAAAGTGAVFDLYTRSGFSQVQNALLGPNSEEGLCSFGNTYAICPFVLTVEETAVSPIGAHGGYAGTSCWLWTPVCCYRLHTLIEHTIN